MVEKSYKPDVVKVLAEIADKFGMELKNKSTVEKLELPSDMRKDYMEMKARDINLEIKEIEDRIKKLEVQGNKTKLAVINYMNKSGKDIGVLRRLFMNGVFDERKISIINKELRLQTNLKLHLLEILEHKMETELVNNFVTDNKDYKGIVSNIVIVKSPTGDQLQVWLSKSDAKDEKKEEEK